VKKQRGKRLEARGDRALKRLKTEGARRAEKIEDRRQMAESESRRHVKEKRSYDSPYDVNNVPFFGEMIRSSRNLLVR